MKTRHLSLALILALLVTLLPAACGPRHEGPAIVVAGGPSEEALLLAEMALVLLEENGYATESQIGLPTDEAARAAVEGGSADLYFAYTGETWSAGLHHHEPLADADLLFRRIRTEDAEGGIAWLGPIAAEARLALVVAPALAEAGGLLAASDLASYQRRVEPNLRICAPEGLAEAAAGVRGLERVYGLRFGRRVVAGASREEGYRALAAGECDCALAYTNDSAVRLGEVQVLADDRAFAPPSSLALGVRRERLDAYPALEELLSRLVESIDEEALTALERQVAVHGMDRRAAVRAFLRRGDLLPTWPNLPGREK